MKRILYILPLCVALFSVATCYAQKDKVVEASAKYKPQWIGHSDTEAFAVTEVAPTLAEATSRCEQSIRQYVVNAIAVNVSSSERMVTRQITQDNLSSVMNDYSSVLMSEAGKLPYLNDLSLSNARDTYWERIYSKKDKSYRYEYSVLYPFSGQTRQALVAAFLSLDQSKQAQLDRLRDEVTTLTDLDRISRAITELDALHSYFFDATRRREVESVKLNYMGLWGALSIEVESEQSGQCLYSLRLGGRRVTTSVAPRLKSNSAQELKIKAVENNCYLLSYDPQYALPKETNTIDISYMLYGRTISQQLYFDAPDTGASVQAVGTLRLEQREGELVGWLQLRTNGKQKVSVGELTLFNPHDEAAILARQITPSQIASSATTTVQFISDATLVRAENGLETIRGVIVVEPTAGGRREIRFTLPYKLTIK